MTVPTGDRAHASSTSLSAASRSRQNAFISAAPPRPHRPAGGARPTPSRGPASPFEATTTWTREPSSPQSKRAEAGRVAVRSRRGASGEPARAHGRVDERVEQALDPDRHGLRGGHREAVRALSDEAAAAGALVAHGDRLRVPPQRLDLELGRHPAGDLAVRPLDRRPRRRGGRTTPPSHGRCARGWRRRTSPATGAVSAAGPRGRGGGRGVSPVLAIRARTMRLNELCLVIGTPLEGGGAASHAHETPAGKGFTDTAPPRTRAPFALTRSRGREHRHEGWARDGAARQDTPSMSTRQLPRSASRVASDAPAIAALMRASILDLFPHFYDARQTASAAVQ